MTTPRFILHHYEASPYAEKIRLMMGRSGQTWGSVLSPPFPPRPHVDPLAGGYRRIPVAQVGADLFCDTALIAREVADLSGVSSLAPVVRTPEATELVERAQGAVFFSAITATPPHRLMARLFGSLGAADMLRFVKDRMAMMRGATVELPSGADAKRILETFFADVDAWLEGRDSIDDAPDGNLGYADFCVYHPLWLARSVGSGDAIERHTELTRWMAGMTQLGHGERVELAPEAAFSAASGSEPRALPDALETHDLQGETVTVAPADYGTVPVRGRLVAVATGRLVLARETGQFGTVHVHFPRAGYRLSRA